MSDLATVFRRPFPQQIAAFRLRLANLVPTAKWDDLWQDQHNTGFMVAGATKADLLKDLGEAMRKAIEDGTSLEEFRRDFRRIVEDRGWHGWTGEDTARGRAWRTRVIYRTNMRTSYMAGRFAQLTDGNFAFWIYRHGGSAEPRLHHLSWDGIALPPDHPFWTTHFPPNGWGCSCYVLGARSRDGVRRRGGDPDKDLPENWRLLDGKTGAPKGIDRGWAYAPGASVAETVSTLAENIERLPEQLSAAVIRDFVAAEAFTRWFARPAGSFPLARLGDADAEAIGATVRVAHISAETALKQARNHPELTAADYLLVQTTINEATAKVQDDARSLVFLRDDPAGHLVVVKATVSGENLFVVSLRRMSGDASTRQRLIDRILRRR